MVVVVTQTVMGSLALTEQITETTYDVHVGSAKPAALTSNSVWKRNPIFL